MTRSWRARVLGGSVAATGGLIPALGVCPFCAVGIPFCPVCALGAVPVAGGLAAAGAGVLGLDAWFGRRGDDCGCGRTCPTCDS